MTIKRFALLNLTAALVLALSAGAIAQRVRVNGAGPATFTDVTVTSLTSTGTIIGVAGTFSGAVSGTTGAFTGVLSKIANITTAGNGVPITVAVGRQLAQAAADASVVTFTVGAADASFEVSSNVNVVTATTHTFNVECAYTDETNTARVVILPFRLISDTTAITNSVVNTNSNVPYLGVPLHLRAKAATSILIRTQAAGTYTTVSYNIEGIIRQIS